MEEDDDKIPMMDIEVGAVDGTPHLMINENGKEKWALTILNKSIGEEGYYKTYIADEEYDEHDDDYDEEYDDDDDEMPSPRSLSLDDFIIGEITASEAEMLSDETLQNIKAIKKRKINEVLSIGIEFGIRQMEALEVIEKIDNDTYVKTPEFILFENCNFSLNSNKGSIYLEDFENVKQINTLFLAYGHLNKRKAEKATEHIFSTYKTNFYALYNLYFILIWQSHQNDLRRSVCKEISNFISQYPLAELLLAYESICYTPDVRFTRIIYSKSITDCFPQYKSFSPLELLIYWLIKLYQNIKENNMQDCVFYYRLASNTFFASELISLRAQQYFSEYLQQRNNVLL